MKTVNIFIADNGHDRHNYLISPNGNWQVNAVMYLDIDDFEYIKSISIGEGQTRILDDEIFALIILRFF